MQTMADNALAVLGQVPAGLVFLAAPTIEALRARQQEIQAESHALIEAADEAGEDLDDDVIATIQANTAEAERIGRQIAAREAVAPPAAGGNRRTVADEVARPGGGQQAQQSQAQRTVPALARRDDPKRGFASFGDFARTVRAAGGSAPDQQAQVRLQNALTTFGSESVGTDGGFAVPPDFRRDIAEKVMGVNSLVSMTDQQTTSSNSIVFPVDETTPWQTSGGIQAHWEAEGGQKQQSKPALGQETIRLNKLIALVPVTDELLEDAPALDGYLRRKVPDKMTAKINTAIISGTGVGQPKGILNSGGLVVVPKETSQAADTIYFENIVNMTARLYGESLSRAVWLVNQNVLPQLMTMRFSRTATSPVPVWMPATGISGSPYSTLMGRPVVPVQAMPTVGDMGDIVLADMSQYLTVTKGQQIRTDVSIHLFFDYDVTAFRFVMRIAGQPWWNSPITPQNSGDTLGFFVALADRT